MNANPSYDVQKLLPSTENIRIRFWQRDVVRMCLVKLQFVVGMLKF